MNRRLLVLVAVAAIVALLAALSATTAFAQVPTPQTSSPVEGGLSIVNTAVGLLNQMLGVVGGVINSLVGGASGAPSV